MSFKFRALSPPGIALSLLLAACEKPAPVRPAVERTLPATAGASRESSILQGETHAWLLDLTAGTFADLAVDQHGVDVQVSVRGPDGGPLAAADSNFGAWGTEPVPVIAKRPGRYRLEVRLSEDTALSGRYVVRLAALRPATLRDHDRVAAEQLFARSEELRRRGDRPSLQAAAATGLQALAGFQALGGHGREADALYSLARANADLERPEDALAFDSRALALFRAQGREHEEGWTLNLLGQIHRSQGDSRRALELYREALALNRRLAERPAEATTLMNIGRAYRALGKTDEAIAHYQEALDLWRALGNRRWESDHPLQPRGPLPVPRRAADGPRPPRFRPRDLHRRRRRAGGGADPELDGRRLQPGGPGGEGNRGPATRPRHRARARGSPQRSVDAQ